MIGQHDNVGLLDKRDNRIGKLLATRCLVLGDRHVAQKHLYLGQHTLRNRFASDRKRGSVWRMTVHHALGIFTILINFQVQQRFARAFLGTGNLLASHVDGGNILRLQKAFGHHGRCAEHLILADPHTDVAIVCRGKALVIDPGANVTDILFDFVCVYHNSLPRDGFVT